MSKIAQYLQEHVLGEVLTAPDIRRQLAHDASVLRLAPAAALYPRDESDIRKAARFCWQLAERGRIVPLGVRGGGSDTSGGSLSSGIIVLPTAHMNRILELEPKKHQVVVEPGITYDKLQQSLFTHGLCLGNYPANGAFATVGGGISANLIGETAHRFGDNTKQVESLRVVLANGEVIETGPVNKRELSKKMGQSNFEGHVYRSLDKLLEDHAESVAKLATAVNGIENGVGYKIEQINHGSDFNLTPLFIGAQGTLGIITDIGLKVQEHRTATTLALVSLGSFKDMAAILSQILALKPILCDFVTGEAMKVIERLNPSQLAGSLDVSDAAVHLFIEFDEIKKSERDKKLKTLGKIVDAVDGYATSASSSADQQRLQKLRQSVATILMTPDSTKRAVPVADNLSVPPSQLPVFLREATRIFNATAISGPMWGHAASGVVRCFVHLDLSEVGDRQRFTKLTESLYNASLSVGGSIAASAEGRVGAPYVPSLYGKEFSELMRKIKAIFDPHGILNPGVKATDQEQVLQMLRNDYNLAHHHEHLPRS